MSVVARWAGRLVFAAAALAVVAAVAVFLVIPRFTGGAALTVLSGSMSPTIPVGSVVLVVPADPATIEPGDVITYQVAPGVAEYVTHRVVRVQADANPPSFVTKGDANPGEDQEPVVFGAVRGTVRMHIPYAGRVGQLARTPLGLVVLAGIPALWFAAGRVRVIARELRKSPEAPVTPA